MSLAIANRQSASANPADWVRAADAARVLECSLRHVVRRAALQWSREGRAELRPDGKSKPCWWIHREVDARLSRFPDGATRDDRVRDDLLAQYPLHDVERAQQKVHWLTEWRRRCQDRMRLPGQTDRDLAARIVREAKDAEGEDFEISVRSLQMWKRDYARPGEDGTALGIRGVIDQYVAGNDPQGSRSPEAVEFFYAIYRTTNGRTVAGCHRKTLSEAARQKWRWPRSLRATAKWLDRHDNIAFTYLCREGKEAFDHRFRPYMEQDWSLVPPGKFYVADHTQCDFWVTYGDGQIRPWLTAIQDCGSRRIVGWVLGPAPNQESILVALRMAFGQAVPEYLRIDNGKDFTARSIVGLSKAERRQLLAVHRRDYRKVVRKAETLTDCDDSRWQGIVPFLGIQLIFATPYNPESKGTLERFFGTMHDQFDKDFATYCGRSPDNRPDTLQDVRDGRTFRGAKGLSLVDAVGVPTMEQADAALAEWLTIYESTAHRGDGMNGRCPRAVWSSAPNLRTAEEHKLDFLIAIRGTYKVGANGVSLTAAGTSLSYGANSAALARYKGRDVLVAVDPVYPARCLAYNVEDRRLIGVLEPNQKMDPLMTSNELREATAAVARAKKHVKRSDAEHYKATLTGSELARRDRVARVREVELAATGTDDGTPNTIPVRCDIGGGSNVPHTAFASVGPTMPEADDISVFVRGDEEDDDASDLSMPIDSFLPISTVEPEEEESPLQAFL